VLRIAVLRFPCASNLTDLEPLAAEPGVVLSFADVPQQLTDADLVVVPGTRATVADLDWLRKSGFGSALQNRAARGLPVLGICGGYQMLGQVIEDLVESQSGDVEGLGLLPVRTVFSTDKVLAQRVAHLTDGTAVTGYQIHHGRVSRLGGEPLFADEGCRVGPVAGTTWHGLFDNNGYRRQLLGWVSEATGRRFVPSTMDWHAERDQQLDRLADAADLHLPTLLEQLTPSLTAGGSG
jgi:adenosylcobyric acid synthase